MCSKSAQEQFNELKKEVKYLKRERDRYKKLFLDLVKSVKGSIQAAKKDLKKT